VGEAVPLLDVVSVVGGGTPARSESTYWNGEIPWATVKDLIGTTISDTLERISRAGLENSASNVVPSGAVILATRIVPGKVALATRDLAFNQDLKALICGPRVDAGYLLHFMGSVAPRVVHMSAGSTVKGVTLDGLSRIRVPLPPLAEQRRMAAVLDKADAIRRKRRESLLLLDEFLRSAFLEMFGDPVRNEKGWEVVPLERIAEVQGGLQVSARRASRAKEVPYLRVANVYRDRLDLSEMKNLGVTDDELARTKLQAGDVLVVEGHGNREEIGRSAVWDGSIDPCVHQNHLIRVRLDRTKAEPDYVSAFLNSAGGRRQMFRFGKTTSGLNTISTGNVRRVQMMLPPIDLQSRHRQLRSQVLASNQRIATALREADGLFDSLAQRAFRGSLSG
jgi:type I restriction enzyme S subunit